MDRILTGLEIVWIYVCVTMECSYPYNLLLGKQIQWICLRMLFLLFCYPCPLCVAQDPFLVSPQDTVVARGSTAVLRCALRPDMGGIVLWSHFDPQASFSSMVNVLFNSELQNRVTIIGRQHMGEFNMRLTNVRETDAGRYECRALIGFTNIVRRSAMLTVIVPPDPGFPKCSMQPPSGLIPGQMVILSCRTQGGKPPTRLNWYQGPNQIGPPTATTNVYRHTIGPSDYGVVYECRESGAALSAERSCVVIPLPATLTVDIRPHNPVIYIGETQTFGCNARGALMVTYSWYINEVPLVMSPLIERFVAGGGNQLLTAFDVSLAVDDTLVTCLATANTGQIANASSILKVVSRFGATTRRPVVTVVASTTRRPLRTSLPDPGTTKPSYPGAPGSPDEPGQQDPTDGPDVPDRPDRPDRPHHPGGPNRPDRERPDRERPDREKPDRDESGDRDNEPREEDRDDLLTQSNDGDQDQDSVAGNAPSNTMTVIGAAMAGVVISVVIVAMVKLMTCVKPGTKDNLITISGSSDSEDLQPNSLLTNRNTSTPFSSFRSTTNVEISDPKRITFSDLNREYDLPPFEPDDSLSYLGLRPESMTSARYMYEDLNSDTLNDSRLDARYYEISSGDYDNSVEYEDVVSEQTTFRESMRPVSALTDEGLYQQSILPVPGYNSRVSLNDRHRLQ